MLNILRRSLRTTLLAFMGGMVAVSTIGLGYMSYDASSESLAASILAKLEAVSQAREAHAVDLVHHAQAELARLERTEAVEAALRPAAAPTPPPADPETSASPAPSPTLHRDAARELLQRVAGTASFVSIALADDEGRVVAASSRAMEGTDLSSQPWWAAALEDPAVGTIVKAGDEHAFQITHPLRSGQGGRPAGVLVGLAKADHLYEMLADREGMGETGETYLIDREGLLLSPSRFVEGAELSQRNRGGAYQQVAQHGVPGGGIWADYRGTEVLGFSMFDHFEANGVDWVLVTEMDEEEALAPVVSLRREIVLFTVVVLALAFALAFLIARSITAPIVRLSTAADRIGAGDLTVALDQTDRQDEVGVLVRSFNTMASNLREIMEALQKGVTSLSSSASQITATAREYAGTAAEQASAVAQTSTTIEEIKQTSRAAAESASTVVDAAEEWAEAGQQGRAALDRAVEAMDVIAARVNGIATKILQLSEQNEQIGQIVESVSDLAEQSNLLAVNASIEAAKAGEQGRGFAVVAAEVRNLAEQSKRATQQIRNILADIQKATQGAVMAAEEGNKRTEDGKGAVEAVHSLVQELAAALEQNADSARQIAGSANQQASGISQVSETLEAIAKGGKDSAMGVQQLEQSVSQLSTFSTNLSEIASRYRM